MKVTITGFIYWHKYSWEDTPAYWHIQSESMGGVDPDYSLVMPHDFEVDIPDDFDPIPGRIDSMRKVKDKILADAQVQANNIEEQIQRLLCIEYKPEAA